MFDVVKAVVKASCKEGARVLGLKLQERRTKKSAIYKRTHDSEGYKKQPKKAK